METFKSTTLVHHFIENSFKAYPDKIALIHEQNRISYRQLKIASDNLAVYLKDQGAKKGDRIILLMENCFEYVAAYYGILKAGAIVVPLETDTQKDSFNELYDQLEPFAVISGFRFERFLESADLQNRKNSLSLLLLKEPKLSWKDSGHTIANLGDIMCDNRNQKSLNEISSDDLASIIYTSGSTGKSKGVMLSHRAIVANTLSICKGLELGSDEIQMVVLPFFYVMGISLLNTHMAVGGTIVINNKFAFPAAVINQMIEEKVTGFAGVPSTYAYLLNRSPLAQSRDRLNHLRYCSQAGGHMSKSLKIELRIVLPERTKIYIMYGATEASARLSILEPDRFMEKLDSIGKPIDGVTFKVVDAQGKEVPQGYEGQIIARGDNIMDGYWKDAESTLKVLGPKGYHTGDIGYCDPEGFYFISGRKDGIIKVGGHRINPQQVEEAILSTNCVIEVTIVPVLDELMGKKMIALVVPKYNDIEAKEIIERCHKVLPKFKVPSKLVFLKVVPKNVSGKINNEKCYDIAIKHAQ
ncbi:MAG: acyl--CoA ligase [Desulfobacteraceae bacterium]|nr:acyl--CoA ligase [Desulfobacteraceae bacterium]